jgi:butyryl-CoA dehydrogenase
VDLIAGKTAFGYALPRTTDLDPSTPPLRATANGNDFLLRGEEVFIVNGDGPGVVCLPAREDNADHLFLIPGGTQGLNRVLPAQGTGAEAIISFCVTMDGVPVPAEARLPKPGREVIPMLTAKTALTTAARAVGTARGALDYAQGYAQRREQFGQPISRFQAVKVLLAEMAIRVEAARHLTLKAAGALDHGDRESHRLASMARLVATRSAARATADAVQVCGGYGYTKDYPLEKMMRHAQLNRTLDGGDAAHLMTVAKAF